MCPSVERLYLAPAGVTYPDFGGTSLLYKARTAGLP